MTYTSHILLCSVHGLAQLPIPTCALTPSPASSVAKRRSLSLREHMIVMTHRSSDMSVVKNPADGLGKVVAGVNHTRNVSHNDLSVFAPRLNCEELHFNVTRPRGRSTVINNVDARLVIHVQRCWLLDF